MKSILVRLGLAALLVGELAGCGGGSTGSAGPAGPAGPAATNVTNQVTVNGKILAAADYQALRPQIDPASISVSITPQTGTYPNITGGTVIKYKVTDQNGNPIVGLGGQSNNPAQTNVTHVPTNYDISFTLAKLIPAANGEPARWVNYFVTKLAVASGSSATPANAIVTTNGVSWTGQYPSADSNGIMVDNGDGTYQYTFLRDPTQTAAIVNALPATWTIGTSTYNKVDLGDPATELNYDPNATTRLGILLTGSQPNTGAAVPGGVQPATGANAVPLVYTLSQAYDFIPATGKPAVPGTNASREIVQAANCDGCHDNVTQKRGIGHISTSSATNGIPPGAYVGRNDPRLCVACHTDQAKFGFPVVVTGTNADKSPNYTTAYYRVDETTVPPKNGAAFIYPRMIHQTHMGNHLIKTGYDLNGHVSPIANCATASLAGANAAQCLNLVGFPQDVRNCTKCHTGTAVPAVASMGVTAPTATGVTPDGDNWKNMPSQVACGACHDGINFITGAGIALTDRDTDLAAGNPVGTTQTGHQGVAGQADNSKCASCHTAASIATVHGAPVQTPNSVALQSGVQSVAYSIKSVTVNATTHQPTIVFQILLNGTAVTSLPVQTPIVNGVSGANVVNPAFQPLPSLVGGPSFTMYWAVPQDGITAPADFNGSSSGVSLGALLIDTTKGVTPVSPAAGYLTNTVSNNAFQADSTGYFTAVLTGNVVGQPKGACAAPVAPATATCVVTAVVAAPVIVPTNAVMVTGAMIGGFTQVGLSAYPYTPAVATTNPNVAAVGFGLHVTGVLQKMAATGYTARRVIAAASLCNNCHDKLGNSRSLADAVYNYKNAAGSNIYDGMSPYFHSGDRNDPTACQFCHNPNKVDSGTGWQVDSSTWLHGIHGASKRTVTYGGAGTDWSSVLFPGQLKDCSQCHLPNTVNFGATGGLPGSASLATLQSNLLWSTTTTGTVPATTTPAGYAVVNPQLALITNQTTTTSPYVTVGTNYGSGYSAAAATAAAPVAVVTQAAGTTLVNSPITSACFSCHTDSTATSHMTTNGGVINQPRSANLASDGVTLLNKEGCLVCHGQGTFMDAAVIHQTQ